MPRDNGGIRMSSFALSNASIYFSVKFCLKNSSRSGWSGVHSAFRRRNDDLADGSAYAILSHFIVNLINFA